MAERQLPKLNDVGLIEYPLRVESGQSEANAVRNQMPRITSGCRGRAKQQPRALQAWSPRAPEPRRLEPHNTSGCRVRADTAAVIAISARRYRPSSARGCLAGC